MKSPLFVAAILLFLASGLLPAATPSSPLRIVTLGDSITKGVRKGVLPAQTFASLVQAQLAQEGIVAEVTNVGIGGERTDQAILRLERDVLAKKPHLVTIMYGTNDSYVDKGKTVTRITQDAYRTHLTAIITKLKGAGVQPVVMTEPAFEDTVPRNGLGEDPNVRLAPYMDICRAVARETKTPLVDHFAHWAAVAQVKVKGKTKAEAWTTDGCHPNPRGHQEVAHRLMQTLLPLAQRLADKEHAWQEKAPFQVQLDVLSEGYDGTRCWVHPRAGALPTNPRGVVLTMQQLLLTGSDIFYALNDMRTDDLGKTWSPPQEHTATLGRRDEPGGTVVAACDFTPKAHAKSGKLLGIGHTVRYRDDKVTENRSRETCFAVYDDKARTWSPWTVMKMPDDAKFHSAGAGSVQRVDLENGDILLPIYFKGEKDKYYSVTVLRCRFDGTTLTYVEHGSELSVPIGRGLYEPSLTHFQGRFYLTMRNDSAGYVCTSDDGLKFSEPKIWNWDSGEVLGNYNTQQHWVTHQDALYLVYTRRDPRTDHVFRHRAPLYIAQIDPVKLMAKQATERVLVPEHGARLGNFGVVEVSENETWVTVAEWMQKNGPDIVIRPDNSYGAANRVYAARLRWATPNTLWNRH